jgi:adenylate kinase family enzyme
MIIHIDGVQGSGKSFICKKLRNSICVDTDDILKNAYNIIEMSQKSKKKMPRTQEQVKKVAEELVSKIIEKKKSEKLVFVGMTVTVPNPDYSFFIRIDDPFVVYKRLLLRELSKIVKNERKIKAHIKKVKIPQEMRIEQVGDMSLSFPVMYPDFLEDYKERLKEAKKKKMKIKNQIEIAKMINSL